jgi:hypothetical protein
MSRRHKMLIQQQNLKKLKEAYQEGSHYSQL